MSRVSNLDRKINLFYILFGTGLVLNCLILLIRSHLSDFALGFLEGVSLALIIGCGITVFFLKFIKAKNMKEAE